MSEWVNKFDMSTAGAQHSTAQHSTAQHHRTQTTRELGRYNTQHSWLNEYLSKHSLSCGAANHILPTHPPVNRQVGPCRRHPAVNRKVGPCRKYSPVNRQVGPCRKEHQVAQLLLSAQHMEDIPLGTVHQQGHKGIAALLIQPYLVGQYNAAVLVGRVGPGGDVEGGDAGG